MTEAETINKATEIASDLKKLNLTNIQLLTLVEWIDVELFHDAP